MSWPTTSYVIATFHQTIGQCAHQSLSITATPELGMILQGIKEITGSHIAQNKNIDSQSNTPLGFTDCPAKPIINWVLQAAKETIQQHMGFLDLSSEATHSYTTVGYEQNVPGNQNKNGNWGKQPNMRKYVFRKCSLVS